MHSVSPKVLRTFSISIQNLLEYLSKYVITRSFISIFTGRICRETDGKSVVIPQVVYHLEAV